MNLTAFQVVLQFYLKDMNGMNPFEGGSRGRSPSMIIGPDFIWLHFPKCAGTSVEKALRAIYKGKRDYQFDPIGGARPVIWHDTLWARRQRDPNFSPGNRRILCCFRRLPSWILSRVHFIATRDERLTPTREMLMAGRFRENNGNINNPDNYLAGFVASKPTTWLRTEFIASDLATALSLPQSQISKHLPHETHGLNYIRNVDFWFTPEELRRLYEACPLWAEWEMKIYGSLLTLSPDDTDI